MLSSDFRSAAQSRAELCRDVEYLRKMSKEDQVMDRMMLVTESVITESEDDEIITALESVECTFDETKDEEVGRILSTTSPTLSFNEMIGI